MLLKLCLQWGCERLDLTWSHRWQITYIISVIFRYHRRGQNGLSHAPNCSLARPCSAYSAHSWPTANAWPQPELCTERGVGQHKKKSVPPNSTQTWPTTADAVAAAVRPSGVLGIEGDGGRCRGGSWGGSRLYLLRRVHTIKIPFSMAHGHAVQMFFFWLAMTFIIFIYFPFAFSSHFHF